MTAEDLRKAILQQAIQGKLVPQDPNDEPASVLLERIREEKARLVKEKKIKKDKNESIIYRGEDNSHYEKFADGTVKCIDDEIPFEIPQSWCWVRLGSIIDFSKSSSVKPNEIAPDAWILDLEDIEKDTGVLLAKKRMKDIQSKSDKHIFYSANVLYSKLRPYLNKVIIADENGYCTSEILAFDFGMILNKYAQIYLMSPYFVDYAMSDAYGVKMPRLGSKQGNNALMPLPPFKEQVRIAEQLAKITPIVNRYASSQSELDRLNAELFEKLKKSVLQEAIQGKLVPQSPNDEPVSVLLERIRAEKTKLFKEGKLRKKDLVDSVIFKGEDNKYFEKKGNDIVYIDDEIPFDIPDSWEWVRFKNLVQFSLGKTPERVDSSYWSPNDFPWVSIADMEDKTTLTKTKEFISQKALTEKFNNTFSPIGTLIMSFKLTIGKVSILGINAVHNEAIISIFPFINEDNITRDYLYNFLSIITGYTASTDAIKGATLNSQKISEMLVPLPPLQEQKRIVEALDNVLASIMRN